MKKTLLIFFIFLSISCFAQLSNKHWIPPLHSRDADQISEQYVYLSTAEITPFLVNVTDGSGNPYAGSPFSLSSNNPIIINIGNGQPTKMFLGLDDVNTVVSDKGIILEGNKDFYVSFRMRSQLHSETLISKGRPGIGTSFRLGCMINESQDNRKSFVASVMATEDNTNITLSGYNTGVVFTSGLGNITSDSQSFENLKAGESIVFSGYSDVAANLDGIIGALITSNNPIAVNTGNVLGGIEDRKADITLDQIVSASQIGNEYIFIEGNGLPSMETPLIVANEDGTAIYINGNATPIATIDAGEYYIVSNLYYQGSNNRNLYVKTSKPVFAYQLLGGGASTATAGLNFIPPLSCFFQNSVNIPKVNEIGNTYYTSDLMILTYPTSTLTVNGTIIPKAQAQNVLGNEDWVTYRISNITGDANVISTGPLAVGVFGFQGTASGYAGYYSGFGSIPQDSNVTVCSNATQDLFDIINGNPETGGTWTVPLGGNSLNGNLFDPLVNIPGEYIYTFTKNCNSALTTISVKVNVKIQNSKNAGVSNSISLCNNSPSLDLFVLLGSTAEVGGSWSPALASGTGVFNPAVDLSAVYTYSFAAIGSCNSISATVNVTNNALPSISTITDFNKCDDNFDGNDTNGFVDFDLTTKTNEVLNTQTGISITYHTLENDAELGQNDINTIYTNNRIIYVRQTNTITGCHVITQFNLRVNPKPIVNSIILKQCDDDTDGVSYFNLTEKNSFISTNYSNEVFSYFTTLNGANINDSALKIGTPTAYNSGSETVWARVENSNGCFSTSKINLIVSATQINETTFHKNFTVCDDYIDASNDDKDGIATFNFSIVTANIQGILPSPSSAYTIKYYKNEADALAETNEIPNTTTYRNVGYPNQQQIWVRVDSNLDNACFGLGNYVTLTVEKLPVAHEIPNYKECDEISNDGLFTFNTSTLQSTLLSGQSNVTITYLDQNNNPLPSPFPNSFATGSQIIKARVTNTTTNTDNAIPCYDETSITFIVDKHPVANPVVILPACDDAAPSDTDGLNNFDTSAIESTILNGQVGMVVKYFDSNDNSLPSPLPNPFHTATQNVKVTVENPLNTTCTEETILQFVVNSFPYININANGDDDELVCSNLPAFFVQLHAGIQNGTPPSSYTYQWKKDGITIPGETQETLNVNTEGIYTVEVSTVSGCSRARTIKVTASDIAHLDTIKIIDLVDVNSIAVNVTGQGQYEYSLDEPYGPFQVSPLFENVSSGIHEVYINDRNGCGIISLTVAVLGVPKYFTPNGDGYNDFWSVKGVNANFNSNSIIFIYDRYGKLITKINTNSEGWDGTFNGNTLPADDYWYTIKLDDGREAKGHFSLKR
jgi:gliding motility-associated-like protein